MLHLPDTLALGFVAVEDRRFFGHGGFEFRSIVRAAVACLKSGRFSQGGSTITQQLARTKFGLTHEKTIRRKLREIKLARLLERRFSKREILEQYLQKIYLGEGQYGVFSASRHYFGREPWELSIDEQAILIGLAKSPARYAPRNHVACEIRKGTVLSIMRREGVI